VAAFERQIVVDTYALADLASVAPWVASQIQVLGLDEVRSCLSQSGLDPDRAHRMAVWVDAVSRCRGPLWQALDA